MAAAAEQKYMEAQGGTPAQTVVPSPEQIPPAPVGCGKGKRGIAEAYVLGIPFGFLGAHHFYLRRPGWGALYLFTLGLFGVGWVVDWIRMPWLVKKANRCPVANREQLMERSLAEAYLLWMPLGLFGAHHFYLRNWGWAVGYFLTIGFFGLGWLIDVIMMKSMVDDYNTAVRESHVTEVAPGEPLPKEVPKKYLSSAYRLCLFPITGLLGAHHYYMGRIAYGLFYTFTLGGLGVSWLSDWIRLPWLVKDANRRRRDGRGFKERRLDDCYFVAFPCGLFGAHHFYMRRVGWGFLYFFTVGCLGIGWIVDLARMPCLVRIHKEEMEKKRKERQSVETAGAIGQLGHDNPAVHGGHVQPGQLVVAPGNGLPQYVQTLAPGAYQVQPMAGYVGYPTNLPQGVLPGAHPPAPPGYQEAGYTSWSTIESSEVDQPPSYQDSLTAVHQNLTNEASAPHETHKDLTKG